MEKIKLAAVIVTYNPEIDRLKDVINSIVNQVDFIIIVDNGSKNINDIKEICSIKTNIEIIENDINYGIGKALNIGIEKLKNNYDWILTLDQDSIVLYDDLKSLIKMIDQNNVGVIALKGAETKKNNVEDIFIEEKYPIIISGSIINALIFLKGVKYREEFFLDHVDTDFDFQVRNLGFKILKTTKKMLDHQWGKEVDSKNKKRRCQPNLRVYYTIRNGTRLLLEKKLNFRTYILDNISYIRANLYCNLHKNVFSILIVTLIAFIDGLFNNFKLFKKLNNLF